jgi:peptidoglycan/LPS O-acetylase OafA/YrhL
MSLEMQLYLTFPLLIFVVAKRGWLALIPVVVLSLIYRVIAGLIVEEPNFPTLFLLNATAVGKLVQFVIGMVAAVLAIRWRSGMRWWGHASLAATVVGAYEVATAPAVAQLLQLPLRDTLLGVAFGALVILAVTSRPVERVLAIRPLARLGFVAYSVFLVHEPVAYYLSQFLERGLGVPEGRLLLGLMWTVGLAVVLVVGHAFHHVVEKPCIAWSRAAVGRRPADRAEQHGEPASEAVRTSAVRPPAARPVALERPTAPGRRTSPRRRPSAGATRPRWRGTTRWCPRDPTGSP